MRASTCCVTSRYIRLKHARPSAAGRAASICCMRAMASSMDVTGGPVGGSTAAVDPPPPASDMAGLTDHDRDVALGALLVTGVSLVGGHDRGPQLGLLGSRGYPGPHLPGLAGGEDLHLDIGVRHQV